MPTQKFPLRAQFVGGEASGSASLTVVNPAPEPPQPPLDFWDVLRKIDKLDTIAEHIVDAAAKLIFMKRRGKLVSNPLS